MSDNFILSRQEYLTNSKHVNGMQLQIICLYDEGEVLLGKFRAGIEFFRVQATAGQGNEKYNEQGYHGYGS